MFLVTYTGKPFDYQNITPESIDVEDIIHALPRINRFIGHSKRAYTVAEHTIWCLAMAEELGYTTRQKLLVFLHDFPEAYTGDCPTPLKRLLPEFKEIEEKIETALYQRLGVTPPTYEEHLHIKRIDWTMLALEMRDLTLHDHTEYINAYTYEEIMEDEAFNIHKVGISEEESMHMLKLIFKDLLMDYLVGEK